MRGIISIVIGSILVIGAVSGNMVLRGTQSSTGLAVVGGVVILVGVVRVIRRA